jgi:hypothetical protein
MDLDLSLGGVSGNRRRAGLGDGVCQLRHTFVNRDDTGVRSPRNN